MTSYRYLGDQYTDQELNGATCTAIRNDVGKCIRGCNGSMLAEFDSGRVANVIGRLLLKLKPV